MRRSLFMCGEQKDVTFLVINIGQLKFYGPSGNEKWLPLEVIFLIKMSTFK